MIERKLHRVIKDRFFKGKAIILIGARQVGKTTLLQELTNGTNDVLWLNGDELATRTLLQEVSVEKFRSLIGSKTIIIVDEAQRIENIGLKMKLITDNLPNVQLILTGSSSFELANRVNEPLTGRKWEYTLFPFSFAEMAEHTTAYEFKWNPKKKAKISQTFLKAYPNTEIMTVNPDNFYTLLL